jgi:hypothetical protein
MHISWKSDCNLKGLKDSHLSYLEDVIQTSDKKFKGLPCSLAWCYTSVILALRRLKQGDPEFEVSLGYKEKHCLNSQPPQKFSL